MSSASHRRAEAAPLRSAISLEGVRKVFKTRRRLVTALDDVSAEIREGEFFCVVGPSGCGKTTLLRILAGLEEHTDGRIRIAQRNPEAPLTAMVFQEQSVFPWMTVRQNVGYGLAVRRVDPAVRRRVVDEWVQAVGLGPFADAFPGQLSGGMKQRVSIARAFANDPEILLMDEPFSALDEQNKILLQQELLRIWEGRRKTVVFITHSIDEAILLGDRVMVMTAHPGRVRAVYDVDIPRPRDVGTVRRAPRFVELFGEIWDGLSVEVMRAKAAEFAAPAARRERAGRPEPPGAAG
jgi:NitT/TauT family transport system ATP-binding protein